MCSNFLAGILVLQSKVAEDSEELKPLQKFTSTANLKLRPRESSLADFCTSESLTICFFFEQRRLIFRSFRRAKLLKSAREYSDGLDFRILTKILMMYSGQFPKENCGVMIVRTYLGVCRHLTSLLVAHKGLKSSKRFTNLPSGL